MKLIALAALLAGCLPDDYVLSKQDRLEILMDFDADGTTDRGVLIDERDGFRSCDAFLELYLADGHGTHETAEWKEGEWLLVDLDRYPPLAGKGIGGILLATLMRQQDHTHMDWF